MRRPLLLALATLALATLSACTDSPPATATLAPTVAAATPTVAVAPPTLPPPPAATGTPEPTLSLPTEMPTIELPPPPTVPPTPSGMDAAQQVAIYSVVAHDLIGVKPIPYVAIAPKASQGELLDTPVNDRPISPDLLPLLKDRAAQVELAPFQEVIGALEDGGRVQNDGLFLTLGVIETDPDGATVALYASFYRAVDDATGYRYRLTRTGAAWVIKDKTQVWDR